MPKAERIRTKAHLASAKPKPSGDLPSAPPSSIPELSLQGIEEKPQPQLTAQSTKREKMLERRESFLRKLGTGLPALSKNHARRMKRKAKEQLAGDTLSHLSHALPSLEASTTDSAANAQEAGNTKLETKKLRQTVGLIGEGKSRPLSKSQRKRMFELERFRHPRILQNPAFSSNPFQTIQIHAKNTLLKHTPSNP